MNGDYLLFFPSLITERSSNAEYTVDNWETKYEGLQTNEPITKYLLDYLAQKEKPIKQIIMLCTKAVREDKLEKINGMTTLEYYKESIMNYIEKHDYRDLYNIQENQLFTIIEVNEAEEQSIEKILEPLKQIVQAAAESEIMEENHFYVDFTGGLRNAALTMIFACRILQSYGGIVEKILYSNLGEHRITECTKTYYCFDYLAAQVEQKYGGTERTLEYLKKELNADDEVNQFLETFRQFVYDKKSNNVEAAEEKVGELLRNISRFSDKTKDNTLAGQMLGVISKDIAGLQHSKSGTLYLLEDALEKKKYERALRLFREQVFNMLIDLGIIQIQKEYLMEKRNRHMVEDMIVGIYNYYEPINQKKDNNQGEKTRYTFVERVEIFMELLQADIEKEPKLIKKVFKEKYYDLTAYLNQVPKWGFRHNDYSRKECQKKLEPYILEMQKEGKELMDCIEKYGKLERIYLGVGYPFLCTYNERIISGYDILYRKVFDDGVYSLQKLYYGTIDSKMRTVLNKLDISDITYKEFLEVYGERKQEICRWLFPFSLSERDFKSGLLRDEFPEFIYEFMKVFCYAKNMRNKVVHSSVQEKELKKVVEEMKKVLEKIKEAAKDNYLEQEKGE